MLGFWTCSLAKYLDRAPVGYLAACEENHVVKHREELVARLQKAAEDRCAERGNLSQSKPLSLSLYG